MDVSFQSHTAEGGGHLAGAGVTHRRQDNVQDEKERIQCDVSSLVPEIDAVRMALRRAPAGDMLLNILTDSATVLRIATALNKEQIWRNLNPDAQVDDTVSVLVMDLDARTAHTTLTKLASHQGCLMNELADTLPGQAADDKESITHTYKPAYDKGIPIAIVPDDPEQNKDLSPQLPPINDAPETEAIYIMLKAKIPQALMERRQKKFLDPDPIRTYTALQEGKSERCLLPLEQH